MINLTNDLITRIKNSYLSKKEEALVGHSKSSEIILNILKENKFIKDYELIEDGIKKNFKVTLLYSGIDPVLAGVKIMSKPGRRIYKGFKELKPVLGGMGISIISTPKGIMTDKVAISQKLGGEVLFQVW